MEQSVALGRIDLLVSSMGVGAMTWGDPTGLTRLHPAKTTYGGPESSEDEKQAFEAILAGGINFFDTAAVYDGGAAERRLGELAQGKDVR